MARPITIPAGITPAVIAAQLRRRLSTAQRTRLHAVRLALAGKLTAAEIGNRVGIGPQQFFNWMRQLKGRGGLAALLRRGHGGGRRARLSARLRSGLRRRYLCGDRVTSIQHWLESEGVKMTKAGIYYWIRKLRMRRQRPIRRAAPPLRKVRLGLQVSMNETTAAKFLEAQKLTDLSCNKLVEALLLLRNRTESHGPTVKEITSVVPCSRESLYRWVRQWHQAGG
jgi:transposase-like protein